MQTKPKSLAANAMVQEFGGIENMKTENNALLPICANSQPATQRRRKQQECSRSRKINECKMINNYNPQTHAGHLPIRVLQHNLIHWFETASPTILEDMKSEIQFNNLYPGIKYNIVEDKINHLACITEVGDLKVIKLYENFNQFVWCVSYALISIFDEGIQRPIMNNKYTGKNIAASAKPVRGFEVLSAGLSLKNNYSVEVFRKLPNPEIHEENDRFYIEKANSIWLGAMTFVLLHEFGHQYYGHLNYIPTSDEAKRDEFVVDEYAAEQLSARFDDEIGQTLKCGIIVGLLSIILVDKSLKGDAEHPDSDERLKNIVEKLNLDELDNLYGIMSLALVLWGNYYRKEISLPEVFDDYKSMYHHVLGEIKYSKLHDANHGLKKSRC